MKLLDAHTTSTPTIELAAESSPSLSVRSIYSAIAEIMPEVTQRATREPYFRESIERDPRITLQALISNKRGADTKIPDFIDITVVADTSTRVNLVVPPFNEDVLVPGQSVSPIAKVLLKAAGDEDFALELQNSPGEVLARETSLLSGAPSQFNPAFELKVHVLKANEIVVVLPEQSPSRVAQSTAIDNELSVRSGADTVAQHTVDYGCNTSFTNCWSGCHTGSCHTNSTLSGCCR